jgi:hypothetical protein
MDETRTATGFACASSPSAAHSNGLLKYRLFRLWFRGRNRLKIKLENSEKIAVAGTTASEMRRDKAWFRRKNSNL